VDRATEPLQELQIPAGRADANAPDDDAASVDVGDRAAVEATLAKRLGRVLNDDSEHYGVVVEHVPTRTRFVHQPRRPFRAGSVYKLAVAHAILERADAGQLGIDERLTVEADDATEPEPAGGLAVGDDVSIGDALRVMMAVSSNAAAEALLRRLDPDRFNASLAAWGLAGTQVTVGDGASAITTAADMAELLGRVVRGEHLSPEAQRELIDLLALCEEPDGLVDGAPPGVEVLSKAGNRAQSSSVIGTITTRNGPIVISVLDDDVDPGDARAVIGAIARAVLDAYGMPIGSS
jgi:beta-lactamase class A